ncbi:MAG: YIP1 family protein [Bacilli bacterium]|nr:YIP1 family protein [Bacilli bacterium]
MKKFFKQILADYVKFPLRIMSHPVQAYTEFKEDKKAKMSVAIMMLIIASVVSMIQYVYTGPVLNTNDPTKFNSLTTVIYTMCPVIILSVANWSITTLMNGKGKMGEIFMMGCYSYFPVIVCGIIGVIASNFVTEDEAMLVTLVYIIGYALMAYMIFMGLICLHEYGIIKTFATIILTALATCVIAFVALLIFDLSQQIYGFVYSLYKEIVTRFF